MNLPIEDPTLGIETILKNGRWHPSRANLYRKCGIHGKEAHDILNNRIREGLTPEQVIRGYVEQVNPINAGFVLQYIDPTPVRYTPAQPSKFQKQPEQGPTWIFTATNGEIDYTFEVADPAADDAFKILIPSNLLRTGKHT